MKIQIKSRWSDEVIFEHYCENNTIAITLRAAVEIEANLYGANLEVAYLKGANLYGANLKGANHDEKTNWPHFQLPPEKGAFIAYKKITGGIVIELQIPAKAKRTSSLVGRKCRAEYVKVLTKGVKAVGDRDKKTMYETGKITRADKYDDDIRVECTHGIHFFMTRKEAEEY